MCEPLVPIIGDETDPLDFYSFTRGRMKLRTCTPADLARALPLRKLVFIECSEQTRKKTRRRENAWHHFSGSALPNQEAQRHGGRDALPKRYRYSASVRGVPTGDSRGRSR